MSSTPRQHIPFLSILIGFVLSIATGTDGRLLAQAASPPDCAAPKLEIGIPDDFIGPPSSVLLDVKLTNDTHQTIMAAAPAPSIWSLDFEMLDAQGVTVPQTAEWTRAVSKQRDIAFVIHVFPPAVLAPGESRAITLLLNKLFDLSKGGPYALHLSTTFQCGRRDPWKRVTSNEIHFTPDAPSGLATASIPAISVTARSMEKRLPVGWAMPLKLIVQNNSSHTLRWAAEDWSNWAPDEFFTGLEVFDKAGKLLPRPEPPNFNWNSSGFEFATSSVKIPPGKSAEQLVLVGDIFDVGKPGTYGARVSLLDPLSHQRVESNAVSFDIGGGSIPSPDPGRPPLLVTLQPSQFDPLKPGTVLVCISNISDHDILLHDSAGDDLISVADLDGHSLPLTAEEQKAKTRAEKDQDLVGGFTNRYGAPYPVTPRGALCGKHNVGAMYDLSGVSSYRVRFDRYDEPDARPDQKLRDLPIVHSNWMIVLLDPPAPTESNPTK